MVTLILSGCVTGLWYLEQHGVLNYSKFICMIWPFGERERPWMTVFVHGSFCSPAAFLDFNSVTKDEIEDSIYSKVIHRMREDLFFQQEQPILGRGLIRICPQALIEVGNSGQQAAYPILSAYSEILRAEFPETKNDRFYLFGWTGLMSQKRRRKEAVRLYNSLFEEVSRLRKKGIEPRMRILAHSHGANVVLNLAGLREAINGEWESIPDFEEETCLKDVCNHFEKIISDLPSKNIAKRKKGQKRWDYMPEGTFDIDEVIMFGAPLQPETAYFSRSPFFKTVVNIYSDEDGVQGRDWLSTSHTTSEKRFDGLPLKLVKNVKNKNRVIQVRVTAGLEERDGDIAQNNTGVSWLKTVFGLDNVVRKTMDPTHRELWCLVPYVEGELQFLKPVPTVVLTPIIIKLLSKVQKHNDVDIDFSFKEDSFFAVLLDHSKGNMLGFVKVEKKLFEFVRERLMAWMPINLDDERRARDIMEECIQVCSNIS